MKLNLNVELADAKGNPFQDKAKLGDALYGAMNSPMPADNQLPLPEQIKRYRLLQLVGKGGEIEVTAEDIAMLKERVSKLFPISVVGAVTDLLESLTAPRLIKPEEPQAAPQANESA